jgi:hypothetical protein
MKRTLYLDSEREFHVVADGESLLVKIAGLAPKRIPFRYLLGVEAKLRGVWSGMALGKLAEKAIPVVMRGGDGRIVAYFWGQPAQLHSLSDRLREARSVYGFQSSFLVWRDAKERRQILRCVRRYRLEPNDLRRKAVEGLITGWMRKRHGFGNTLEPVRQLQSHLEGECTRFLLERGFDPVLCSGAEHGSNLAADLAWIVVWKEIGLLERGLQLYAKAGVTPHRLQQAMRWLREAGRSERDEMWKVMLEDLSVWMREFGL